VETCEAARLRVGPRRIVCCCGSKPMLRNLGCFAVSTARASATSGGAVVPAEAGTIRAKIVASNGTIRAACQTEVPLTTLLSHSEGPLFGGGRRRSTRRLIGSCTAASFGPEGASALCFVRLCDKNGPFVGSGVFNGRSKSTRPVPAQRDVGKVPYGTLPILTSAVRRPRRHPRARSIRS
jgi:hypothetical protein